MLGYVNESVDGGKIFVQMNSSFFVALIAEIKYTT